MEMKTKPMIVFRQKGLLKKDSRPRHKGLDFYYCFLGSRISHIGVNYILVYFNKCIHFYFSHKELKKH